jgi:hypothetical protein
MTELTRQGKVVGNRAVTAADARYHVARVGGVMRRQVGWYRGGLLPVPGICRWAGGIFVWAIVNPVGRRRSRCVSEVGEE